MVRFEYAWNNSILALTALAYACLLSSAPLARAADPESDLIKAPCSETGDSYLRKCSDVLPFLKDNVRKRLKGYVELLYQGKAIDPSIGTDYGTVAAGKLTDQEVASTEALALDNAYRFPVPVCSVTCNYFTNSREEIENNHRDESCGDFVALKVNVRVKRVMGACVGATVKTNGSVEVVDGKKRGAREAAYFSGAFIQAIAHFMEQVEGELADKKAVTISSSCKALKKDVVTLGNDAKLVADTINSGLGSQKNARDIWNCKNDWDRSGKDIGLDVGKYRQSAQYLCAARDGIEGAFAQLMVCETLSRAGTDYRASLVDLESFSDKYLNPADKAARANTPYGICEKECKKKCGHCMSSGKATKCSTDCANTCYQRELLKLMKTLQDRWATGGVCETSAALAAEKASRLC